MLVLGLPVSLELAEAAFWNTGFWDIEGRSGVGVLF